MRRAFLPAFEEMVPFVTALVSLEATLPSGAVWTIEARPLPTMLLAQVVPSFARIDIELMSVVPDWVAA